MYVFEQLKIVWWLTLRQGDAQNVDLDSSTTNKTVS